ncbi:MAG: hypothetical protein PHH26_01375 [Candidatus Thermoplasmatota archaeon]|nr:hypothetical protein [Candidatus Thermoplasmatota archaeon]
MKTSRKISVVLAVLALIPMAGCIDNTEISNMVNDAIPYYKLGDKITYIGNGTLLDVPSLMIIGGGYFTTYPNSGSSTIVSIQDGDYVSLEVRDESVKRWDSCRNEHNASVIQYSIYDSSRSKDGKSETWKFMKQYISTDTNCLIEVVSKNVNLIDIGANKEIIHDQGEKTVGGSAGLLDATLFQGEKLEVGRIIEKNLPIKNSWRNSNLSQILKFEVEGIDIVKGYEAYKIALLNPESTSYTPTGENEPEYWLNNYTIWFSPLIPYFIKKVVDIEVSPNIKEKMPFGVPTDSVMEMQEYRPGKTQITPTRKEFSSDSKFVNWSDWNRKSIPDGNRYSPFTLGDALKSAVTFDFGLQSYMNANSDWELISGKYMITQEINYSTMISVDSYTWELHFASSNDNRYRCKIARYYNNAFQIGVDCIRESTENDEMYQAIPYIQNECLPNKIETIENAFLLYSKISDLNFDYFCFILYTSGPIYQFYFDPPEGGHIGFVNYYSVSNYGKYIYWLGDENHQPKL